MSEPAEAPVYPKSKPTCAICGSAAEVNYRLVRWRDPLPGQAFDSAWQCIDRKTCRERTEAIGDIWPVDDQTPASVGSGPIDQEGASQ
jgi:hypothetical protein